MLVGLDKLPRRLVYYISSTTSFDNRVGIVAPALSSLHCTAMRSILRGRRILFEETLLPGAAWSHILKRGTALRLTDPEGGANVGAIFYNADCPVERLNIPDTLKAQHIARLTQGFVLYSDMGRILCSVTADSLGWHDALVRLPDAAAVEAKYGEARYQECRNDFHQNAHDSFLIELEKYGLGPRDLSPNINFFSKVTVGRRWGDGLSARSFARPAASSNCGPK